MPMRETHRIIPHSRPAFNEADFQALQNRIASALVAEGSEATAFEEEVTAFVGAAGAVATTSGTQALVLALLTIGVAGRFVAMPTFSCRALVDATIIAGGRPMLIDIDDHFRLDCDHLAREFDHHRRHIAAIIAVHNLGFPEEILGLKQFAVPIVEDCCAAFGGRSGNAYFGTVGTIGVLSFHATKLLTTGEGGMVISADADLIKRVRQTKTGETVDAMFGPRFFSPMSDLQAALGRAQLSRFPSMLARRVQIASVYRRNLSGVYRFRDRKCGVVFREPMEHREALIHAEALRRHGIMAKRPVTPLLHHLLNVSGEFPTAERLHDRLISLPLYPALSDDDVSYILEAVREVVN